MKKRWTKVLCVTLAAVMLLVTVQPVQAADKYTYSVKTAESGKTVEGENKYIYDEENDQGTYKVNIFKATAPEDGYMTVTVYSKGDESTYLGLFKTLAKAKAMDNGNDDSYFEYAASWSDYRKTIRIPITKGKTIYFRTYATSYYKLKYTFTKATIPTSNLYRAKAATLKTGVKKTICIPDGYQGYRWYKIKVTTKKTISITFKDLTGRMELDYPDFVLYNSSRQEIGVVHGSGNVYKSVKKLPVGTYYIRVNTSGEDEYYFHQTYLYTLSWK